MSGASVLIRKDRSLQRLAFMIVFLMSIAGVQKTFLPEKTASTAVFILIVIVIALIMLLSSKQFALTKFKYKYVLWCYLLYGIFVFAHSLFIAQNYDQWRYLFTAYLPTLLLPFFCLLAINTSITYALIDYLFKIAVPLSFVFLIEGKNLDKNHDLVYVNYVSFVYLLILLTPFLKARLKTIVVIIAFLSLFYDLNNRSNIISIAASTLIIISYVVFKVKENNVVSTIFFRLLRYVFLFLPIILLVMAGFGVFNVFDYIDKIGSKSEISITGTNRIVTVDSRTGVYLDALNSVKSVANFIFGSSAVVIYPTHLAIANPDYFYGRLGGSESGFLAHFIFGGFIYVTLFFLLCYLSSYLAVYKSKNSLVKLVGLFVSFRWFLSFIENTLTLNFTWIIFFISIGMALSPGLRNMSDRQVFKWLNKLKVFKI